MSRKDYRAIAKVIRVYFERVHYSIAETNTLIDLTRSLADVFGTNNARFDRAKFLSACGLDPRY